MDEDYPSTFNMDTFKSLNKFAQRIRYCEENLRKIKAGSGRVVYMIDDFKVLKLAKNEKGVAQCNVEIEYSNYSDLDDVVAKTFDSHPDGLWVEMELARKLKASDFKKITGFSFEDYSKAVSNYGNDVTPKKHYTKYDVDKDIVAAMWEDEFVYSIFNYIGNYGIPAGDLQRLSTYGVVKRNGQDAVIIIDYGLTNDVYDTYYS